MSVNDPIADFIIRLKNASARRQPEVRLRRTKTTEALARVLFSVGFIGKIDTESDLLRISLLYRDDGPAITGVRRLSKPGVRRYVPVSKIPRVRGGLGMVILATSKGIVSGQQALKERVGGEMLCEIW